MNGAALKSLAAPVGKALGVAGMAFVLYKLYHEFTPRSFWEQTETVLPFFPLLVLLNIASSLLGIYAWFRMLRYYAPRPVRFSEAFFYFSRTEVAKYLPGNVFHFVGRQAYASRLGLSQKEMAVVSMLFTLALVVATLIAAALFALSSGRFPPLFLTILAVSSIITATVVLPLFPSFKKAEKGVVYAVLAPSVALQGGMLACIVGLHGPYADTTILLESAAVYVLSWLVGFVTPGASGGLGVREAAFIALAETLQMHISADLAVFAVVFVRFVNIVTDTLLYGATYALNISSKGSDR